MIKLILPVVEIVITLPWSGRASHNFSEPDGEATPEPRNCRKLVMSEATMVFPPDKAGCSLTTSSPLSAIPFLFESTKTIIPTLQSVLPVQLIPLEDGHMAILAPLRIASALV